MSGRPDYDVGDLVVCVGSPNGHFIVGSIWRVLKVVQAPSMRWGVKVAGKPNRSPYGWTASYFRKVDPLPDALTSLLASKPVRESIPA